MNSSSPSPGLRPPSLPLWAGEGRERGPFMESLLSLLRMHWDHEPRRGGRWRASVLDCGSPLPLLRPRARSESARGLAHSKTSRCAGWFMERLPGRKDDDRTVSGGGNEPQLFNTLSAFLASEARRISTPFLA